jgi:hypothetical protein
MDGVLKTGEVAASQGTTALRSGHTPGPWLAAAKPSSVVGWPIVAPRAGGRMIASVTYAAHSSTDPAIPGDRSFNAESEANAHLIAAAPDGLKLARLIVREVEQEELSTHIEVSFPTHVAALILNAAEALIAKAEGRS